MKKKLIGGILGVTALLLVGCAEKKEDVSISEQQTYEETVSSEILQTENDVNESNAEESQKDYMKEIGVTEENKRIVIRYDYANYTEYEVYEFDEDQYQKTCYDFYNSDEDYERELKYVEPDDFCDSTYKLHKYTDDPCRVPLEEAYAGIMDGYMIQKENSSSDSISLVE